MKLFNHLMPNSRRWFGVIAMLPILAICTPSYAEVDIDNHGSRDSRDSRDDDRSSNIDFSQAELDQILAPIALYPDSLLSQVLIAATYPIEVVQADRWAQNNPNYKGADAVAKVSNKDWDTSVKALVAFPDILQRMSDDIDWTQKVGDAFLSDEGRVMDSIQDLRKKAYASGSLKKVKHLKVQREDDQIIIEPAEERIVYVPVYDTRVVYGNWWWPEYQPVYWHYPSSYVFASGFYWGASIYVGPSYYYSAPRWRDRRIVVIDRDARYYREPHFYTSRSVVTFHGSREWRHDPIHRRGVAYYNDNLRDSYGSRHESYRSDRIYRNDNRNVHVHRDEPRHEEPRNEGPRYENHERRRGNYAGSRDPSPVIRNDERNNDEQNNRGDRGNRNIRDNGNPSRLGIDRSEQVRERMDQRNENNNSNEHIDRSFNRGEVQPNRDVQPNRNVQPNRLGIPRQTEHEQYSRPTENERPNRLGVTPSMVNDAQRERTERPAPQREHREDVQRVREVHFDGRNLRRVETEKPVQKNEEKTD